MSLINEKLTWKIEGLDNPDEYIRATEFVRMLRLKCDSVGWCTLNIKNETDTNLIDSISELAKKSNGETRCIYSKTESDIDTEWYVLNPLKECDYEYDEGIEAYRLSDTDYLAVTSEFTIANQFFVDFCFAHKYNGVDFGYVRDISKYQANTYYAILPNEYVKTATKNYFNCDEITISDYSECIDYYGGNLSKIIHRFDRVESVEIPIMISHENEPEADFCCISYDEDSFVEIMVRKRVASDLLKAGLVRQDELIPVRYCDELVHKRIMCNCDEFEILPEELLEEWKLNREKDERKGKREYYPTEKDISTILKNEKKERREDFSNGMKRNDLSNLKGIFKELSPVFKISDGFMLNDEIEMLPYSDIIECTVEFMQEVVGEKSVAEELNLKDCLTIGTAANGDYIIIRQDKSVLRYDHENPYSSVAYNNIWMFIYENIEW